MIAIVGALTGVAGLLLSLGQRSEELAINLDMNATVSVADTSSGYYVVKLSIANGGIRGVVVTDASLQMNGHRVASVDGYLPAFTALADARRADVKHPRRRALPFTVPARGAMIIGLVMDPQLSLTRRLLQTNRTLTNDCCLQRSTIVKGLRLVLEAVPRSIKSVPVRQLGASPLDATRANFDYEIRASPEEDAALGLSVFDPAQYGDRSVTLQIWSDTQPNPILTVKRPVEAFVRFPLGRELRTTIPYRATFSIDGRLIFSGSFRTPCRRLIGIGHPKPPAWSRCGHLQFYEPRAHPLG